MGRRGLGGICWGFEEQIVWLEGSVVLEEVMNGLRGSRWIEQTRHDIGNRNRKNACDDGS